MKHVLFLVVVLGYLIFRGFKDPFWAVLGYYFLAVLRPQAIWEWSLPPGIRWSLIIGSIAIVLTLVYAGMGQRPRTNYKFFLLLILFAVFLGGSFFQAQYKEAAERSAWQYSIILSLMLIGSFAIIERKHLLALGMMILISLSYLIYEVNFLYVFEGRQDLYTRGYGGLDNNGAALMLAMAMPFCFYFFFATKRWWRWLFLTLFLPAAHVIMLSFSRGAMLSSILVGFGMVLTQNKHRVMTILVSIAIGLVALSLAGVEVRERFFSIKKKDTDASAQSRLTTWRGGWNMAKDHPVFGVGLRNSNYVIHRYVDVSKGKTIHNVYIQIAADSGIPSMCCYTGLIVLALLGYRKGWKTAEVSMEHSAEMRWQYYLCKAGFWSLCLYAIGATFLSLETFELPYLLMLMGAAAPAIESSPIAGKKVDEMSSSYSSRKRSFRNILNPRTSTQSG